MQATRGDNMDLQRIDPEYENRMLQFEIDCDNGKGDAWACHSVGEYLAVVKGEHQKAAKVYTENCQKYSHPPSCFNLGRLHLGGKGVEQSDQKALESFDTSCKAGHGMACHHMGLLMLYSKEGGYNVSQDVKKARELLKKGCDEGIPDSCYALASHLLRKPAAGDKNHKREPVKAKALLEAGCARAHGPSCFNLAVMHKKGDEGVPVNMAEYEKYKNITEELIKQTGSLSWQKGH